MGRLIQVEKRQGRIDRQQPGVTPPIELLLEPNQRLVSCELKAVWPERHRKTVDWTWTAYIEHDLSPPQLKFSSPCRDAVSNV